MIVRRRRHPSGKSLLSRFVTPNQWHSCGVFSLDAFFAGRPKARALYNRFIARARRVGDFDVIPQKTRIAFLAKTR